MIFRYSLYRFKSFFFFINIYSYTHIDSRYLPRINKEISLFNISRKGYGHSHKKRERLLFHRFFSDPTFTVGGRKTKSKNEIYIFVLIFLNQHISRLCKYLSNGGISYRKRVLALLKFETQNAFYITKIFQYRTFCSLYLFC